MLKDLPSSQLTPTFLQSAVEVRSSLTDQSQVLPVKLNLVPVIGTATKGKGRVFLYIITETKGKKKGGKKRINTLNVDFK